MRKLKKFYGQTIENVRIEKPGAKGVCIARHEGQVVMVPLGAPDDIADVKIIGRKKRHLLGKIETLHTASPDRIDPFCEHFGACGGCKWQHLNYAAQLKWKHQEVVDNFERLGGFPFPEIPKTIGSDPIRHYRNKMEYAFSADEWVPDLSKFKGEKGNAAGFHVSGYFDKVLDIDTCHLQAEKGNEIRNFIRDFALENGIGFYNIKAQSGFLRTLMLRNNRKGDWMLVLSYGEENQAWISLLKEAIVQQFPDLKSVYFVYNPKVNDALYDLDMEHVYGETFITENLDRLEFNIQPRSFFQTNPYQAEVLYREVAKMANLQKDEVVYDLYCGTGTIGLFLSEKAGKLVGIESVPEAIVDAKENAIRNGVENAHFTVGDMRDLFNADFIEKHGKPDLLITDPPRAGMHPKVVKALKECGCPRIVYVSCNPATQARDLIELTETYTIEKVQPVDMFPHTHHIENIVLLTLK